MDLLVVRKEEKTVAFIAKPREPCGRPQEEIMHRKGEVWKKKTTKNKKYGTKKKNGKTIN